MLRVSRLVFDNDFRDSRLEDDAGDGWSWLIVDGDEAGWLYHRERRR